MNLYTPSTGTTPLQEFTKDAALMIETVYKLYSGKELATSDRNALTALLETFFTSIDKRMEL